MVSNLSLLDLKPRSTSFNIDFVGEDKTQTHKFDLRPFTVADEVWMAQEFPDHDKLVAAMQNIDMEIICKITYHQMTIEGKRFLSKNVSVIDLVDGEEVELAEEGYKKLMHAVSGVENQLSVYTSLMEARGISVPSSLEDISTGKKQKAKGSTLKKRTGRSLLTRLLLNLVGR